MRERWIPHTITKSFFDAHHLDIQFHLAMPAFIIAFTYASYSVRYEWTGIEHTSFIINKMLIFFHSFFPNWECECCRARFSLSVSLSLSNCVLFSFQTLTLTHTITLFQSFQTIEIHKIIHQFIYSIFFCFLSSFFVLSQLFYGGWKFCGWQNDAFQATEPFIWLWVTDTGFFSHFRIIYS